MRITNRLDFPDALVRAVANDGYSRGDSDLTATEVPSPPRLVALRRRYEAELSEDVAERIWSLFGQVTHGILERAGSPNALVEERLFTTVRGWKVSGQLDHYTLSEDGRLDDWKVSSTWSAKNGGKADWIAQANILALLLREHGFPVQQARVILICRDWRKNEALRYSDYPQSQVIAMPMLLWPATEQSRYLDERVRLHQEARAALANDEALPHCSPSDRWQKEAVWAVVKDGNKKATKLCKSEAEAVNVIGDAPKMHIEFRPGMAVRCSQYCSVVTHCQALADGQWLSEELTTTDEDAA
jgi:hypothetical protein